MPHLVIHGPLPSEQAARFARALQEHFSCCRTSAALAAEAIQNTNQLFSELPFKEAAMARNRNEFAQEHLEGTRPFFVIWNPLSPLTITQTYDTEAEAWKVAEDMARKCRARFFVLSSHGSAVIKEPVVRDLYGR